MTALCPLELGPDELAAYKEVRRCRDLQLLEAPAPEEESLLERLRRCSEEVWLDHKGNPEMESLDEIKATLARAETDIDEPCYFC